MLHATILGFDGVMQSYAASQEVSEYKPVEITRFYSVLMLQSWRENSIDHG